MRFFNLASFKGQLNLVFTLLLVLNIIRFAAVVFSTANLQSQANELRLLNNAKVALKDLESEYQNAKLYLMHLIQGFTHEDRQSWQARFKRSILNMNDLEKNVAAYFDSLAFIESRLATDSLAIVIKDFERKADRLFELANTDSLSNAQRKALYEDYVAQIEDETEPLLLKILYFDLGKKYIDDKRLALLEAQATLIGGSGWLSNVIFVISSFLILLFWYLLVKRTNFSISRVYNKLRNILSGKLTKDDSTPLRDELRVLDHIADQITNKLIDTVAFVDALGEGKYDVNIEKFNDNDRYTGSLLKMRDALRELAIKDSKRNWANETTAKFAELLRSNTKNLSELSHQFLQLMVKEIHAQIGGVYLLKNTENEKQQLVLTACYAYGRNKKINTVVAPGEGLCGQCFLEAETILIKTTPQNFFAIPAGIGDIEPTVAAYVPIKLNTKVLGVLEMASLKPFEEHEIDVMEKVAALFAATIETIQNLETNTRLLEQSQMLAEDLRAREEEMRQNMEELTATQEEMMRTQTELFHQFDELDRAKQEAEEKLLAETDRLQKIIQEKEHIIEQLTAKIHS
ncbi:MAG: GAF domain-containing protein [Cytophagales bacterium]|nr:GAF domain-containing protein [Bernardetiaceae bacterium]MDW8203535.1 GAF domain-containing protein [Cytophagales bacterium]